MSSSKLCLRSSVICSPHTFWIYLTQSYLQTSDDQLSLYSNISLLSFSFISNYSFSDLCSCLPHLFLIYILYPKWNSSSSFSPLSPIIHYVRNALNQWPSFPIHESRHHQRIIIPDSFIISLNTQLSNLNYISKYLLYLVHPQCGTAIKTQATIVSRGMIEYLSLPLLNVIPCQYILYTIAIIIFLKCESNYVTKLLKTF